MPANRIRIGRIGKPHALRGELKVIPETEDPARYESLESVFVGAAGQAGKRYPVRSVAFQPYGASVTVLLGLDGISSREEAETLRGLFVYVDEDDLPALKEGEWFIDDLIGLNVLTEDDVAIGTVSEVLELPAQPVMVVDRPEGSSAMIPAVAEFVLAVDTREGIVRVALIEGLLD